MSKSILVIDTPENCIDCPCHFAGMSGQVWCGKENKELLADDIQTFKPDWCPLKDVPSKKKEIEYLTRPDRRGGVETYGETRNREAIGWNMCIDEILKGGEVE